MKYVKNKDTIHFIEDDNKYACLKAVDITFIKSTQDWNKVTCTRCVAKRPLMLKDHLKAIFKDTVLENTDNLIDEVFNMHRGEIVQ